MLCSGHRPWVEGGDQRFLPGPESDETRAWWCPSGQMESTAPRPPCLLHRPLSFQNTVISWTKGWDLAWGDLGSFSCACWAHCLGLDSGGPASQDRLPSPHHVCSLVLADGACRPPRPPVSGRGFSALPSPPPSHFLTPPSSPSPFPLALLFLSSPVSVLHIFLSYFSLCFLCVLSVFLCPSLRLCAALCLVAQSCPTLFNHMDCSPPGSSVHGIFLARILEWVAMPSSRGSSQPRE